MTPAEELRLLLRPAAGGLYLVSSGLAAQQALQRRIYGVSSDAEVAGAAGRAIDRAIARDGNTKVVILGVPSDVGAGYLRGANLGPQAIRQALLDEDPRWPEHSQAAGVVDLGDVFVVPQLLHDSMLSESQLAATRAALYPQTPADVSATLPVSPLSIAERILGRVLGENPDVRIVLLGGDHSTAWPAVAALAAARGPSFAIVQIDAHTDLLAQRLGITYCFGTWSYQANELLGRGGRLVQLGIRASRFDRSHWENTLGVRQFWAAECRQRPEAVLDELIAHLEGLRIRDVYFTNDIDGTDELFANATGTPEPEGLYPDFVVEVIRRLGRTFRLIGGDIMEVAPSIPRRADGTATTLATAVRYLRETLAALGV